MLSFYHRGSKLILFLLHGQRFPRQGATFKIAIFGHETWQVAKVPEVAHMLSFYPQKGQNWVYMRSTGSSFRDTGEFSKLPRILTPGLKISLRVALQSPIFQIIEVFGFPIGHNGEFQKFVRKSETQNLKNRYFKQVLL